MPGTVECLDTKAYKIFENRITYILFTPLKILRTIALLLNKLSPQ